MGLESQIQIDSCGTSDYHIGDNADPRTRANALKNGVTIEHSARQLIAGDLDEFDFIFAMDESNLRNILHLANGRDTGNKVRLMRDFDPIAPGAEVPDPYHGDEADFQEVFDILDRSTDQFLQHINEALGRN